MTEFILPVDFDRDTGPFFEAARQGRLVYRICKACGKGIHMPTQFCGNCGKNDTDWRESSGTGKVFSWTTVTDQVHPAYQVPYTIVVVSLDDAPEVRLIGTIPGHAELKAGQSMKVVFDADFGPPGLPQWRPL
jgi:hypothetical protein